MYFAFTYFENIYLAAHRFKVCLSCLRNRSFCYRPRMFVIPSNALCLQVLVSKLRHQLSSVNTFLVCLPRVLLLHRTLAESLVSSRWLGVFSSSLGNLSDPWQASYISVTGNYRDTGTGAPISSVLSVCRPLCAEPSPHPLSFSVMEFSTPTLHFSPLHCSAGYTISPLSLSPSDKTKDIGDGRKTAGG